MKSKLIKNIVIKTLTRKKWISKKKKWLSENIEKENFLEPYYEIANDIFYKSAEEYVKPTNKSKNSLFKLRVYDKDYIRPQIEKYLNKQEEAQQVTGIWLNGGWSG